MAKMNIAVKDRPKVKLECLRLLTKFKLDPARVRLISGFVDTYLRLNTEDELRFSAQAVKLANIEERTGVMDIVTSWMEKGLEQGMQQGMQQKACEDILDVLGARFEIVPYTVTEKLRDIEDLGILRTLLWKACTCQSPNELLT
jgi:hypothetical protein